MGFRPERLVQCLYPQNSQAGIPMTEERKFASLFAATLLCARKLAELDSDKPSPAKIYVINTAIEKAAFIMGRMTRSGQAETSLAVSCACPDT